MLDRRLLHIQADLRDDLTRWATRRRLALRRKAKEAHAVLAAAGRSVPVLREQWALQRAAQLSIRKREPLARYLYLL